jgi:hypothetical protein
MRPNIAGERRMGSIFHRDFVSNTVQHLKWQSNTSSATRRLGRFQVPQAGRFSTVRALVATPQTIIEHWTNKWLKVSRLGANKLLVLELVIPVAPMIISAFESISVNRSSDTVAVRRANTRRRVQVTQSRSMMFWSDPKASARRPVMRWSGMEIREEGTLKKMKWRKTDSLLP